MNLERTLRTKYRALFEHPDERQRRLVAAADVVAPDDPQRVGRTAPSAHASRARPAAGNRCLEISHEGTNERGSEIDCNGVPNLTDHIRLRPGELVLRFAAVEPNRGRQLVRFEYAEAGYSRTAGL